jgi:preprotein translocase subunit Sss1
MMYAIKVGWQPKEVWEVMAAILLGIVGAVIYVMLPNGKINIVAGLDEETKLTNIARVIIGGIMGFVIYLITPDVFSSLQPPKNNSVKNALGLLYPLVGGYSISLVVGVLSKAVTAVELTLGLDEKKNVGALRK